MSNIEAENKVQDSEPEADSNNEHAFVKPEVSVLAEKLVNNRSKQYNNDILSQVFVMYAVSQKLQTSQVLVG